MPKTPHQTEQKPEPDTRLIEAVFKEIVWHGCRVYLRNGAPCLAGDVRSIPSDTLALLKQHRDAAIHLLRQWDGAGWQSEAVAA